MLHRSISISAIVPHYNRSGLVRKALESIHNQTVKPTEIILVDDNSQPEHRAELQNLQSLATLITTPRNLGLAGTRNYGAQQAAGEWLAFLDDDDLWVPDKLERQLRYLQEHPTVEALGGGLTMVTPDGHQAYWGKKPTRQLTLGHALCYTASMAQALIIRRDVFLGLGGFNPQLRYLEDYEFGIRLLASGHITHFLAEPLFIYYRGGREQLSLEWQRMFKAELNVLDMHSNLVRKEFGPKGPMQLRARCFKKRGTERGRLIGRGLWALGCGMELLFGQHTEKPFRQPPKLQHELS